MKIIRNGAEYELTARELYDAHEEYEYNCLIEDIKSKAEEMEINLTDENLDDIAYFAQRAIDRDDYLWESRERDIEYALESI